MTKSLNFLKKSCKKRDIPTISENTESFIHKTLEKEKSTNCVEIWSAIGYSIVSTARTIQKRWGKITWFEISFPSYKEAINNIYNFEIYNAKLYNIDFLKIPLNKIFNERVDFLFVDWRKKDYLKYLLKIYPFLAKWANIIFDDVIMFQNKMQDLYDFLKKHNINYQIQKTEFKDGLLYLKFQKDSFKKCHLENYKSL